MSSSVSPLDTLLSGEAAQRTGLVTAEELAERSIGGWRDGQYRPGVMLSEVSSRLPVAQEPGGIGVPPRLMDRGVLPGADVFTDMRLALELNRDPGAAWFEEMQAIARSEPDPERELTEDVKQDAGEFLSRMFDVPMRSFAGPGASELNNQMLKAESLMDIGHFQEAADRYDRAHQLDPANPLPLIGKGHALLAMGAYSSAAESLVRGLERYPDIARFTLDLTRLMGGGENIDIRRADLMQRLQQNETPDLLFLLGYLEYHTGDRARGLEHLEQAARHPRAARGMAVYPSLLRGEGTVPAPSLDDGAAPRPAPAPPSETLILPPREG
jgi:hypothetical protein